MIDQLFKRFKLYLLQFFAVASLLALLFTIGSFSSVYFSEDSSQVQNTLTGFVPRDTSSQASSSENVNADGSLFTSEEGVLMSSYDEQIIETCKRHHKNNVDCFYLLKSIMSITSRGNPTFVDARMFENWYGLIPLPETIVTNRDYASIFTTEQSVSEQSTDSGNQGSQESNTKINALFIPEQNLEASAKFIMQLYSRYNEDLQFTIIAYLSGISLANELTREFINDEGLSFRDGDITSDMIIEKLERAFNQADKYSDMPLQYQDVVERFQNILRSYAYWAQTPMRASSSNEVLYEFGTYAVRPSFSAVSTFNATVFEVIETTVSDFLTYAQTGNPSSPDYSFSSFQTYITQLNPSLQSTTGATANNANGDALSHKGLSWYDTACSTAEARFYAFVSRFALCLHSEETTCDCSFSDIILDEDYIFRIEQDKFENKQILSFSLLELQDDLTVFTLATQDVVFEKEMQINFDDYPETSLDLHETKNYFDLYMRSGSWNINGFSFSGIVAKTSTSNTQDTTGMINLNFGRENLVASECSYTQTHQLFCVQDPKTFVYRKYPSGFKRVPIEYHFALDLSPNAPEAIDVTDTINAGETDSSTETIPVLELEESIQ